MTDDKMFKQAHDTFKTMCKALDADDWHYEKNEDELKITCTAQGEDLPIPIVIRVNPDKALVSVYSYLPFAIPEDRRREMAVAIARANNGLTDGSFDYNYSDGTVLFRVTTSIFDSIISANTLKYMVLCACHTVDNYNDKFLMVAKSEMTCDEVAKFIE